jgi:acylphosphatase
MPGARWIVSGRVQGVGYRWFVFRAAQRLGLVGWVRNLADGRVEVCALGDPASLATLEADLLTGPRLAVVDRVEKVDSPPDVERHKSFDII